MKVAKGHCKKCGREGIAHVRARASERLQAKLRLSEPSALITIGGEIYCAGCMDEIKDGKEHEGT